MSDREGNAARVREALEAYNRDDVAGVIGMLDPDVESHVSEELMNAGTWRGLDGFAQMAGAWAEAWGENVYELIDVETPDDRHVLAHVHQRARGAQSGVPVELAVYYLFEFSGERAVRFHVYASREEALAAI